MRAASAAFFRRSAVVLAARARSPAGSCSIADDYARLGRTSPPARRSRRTSLFWRESSYFDAAADLKPLLHLWSLGVEEQFYLVWPMLLVIASRWRARTAGR